MKIKEGDKAPDFELKDQHGNVARLSDFFNKKPVVVYFYPKDDTPGCTKEACAFRDSYEDFKELDAEVIGISSDNETSHRAFASKHQLPFILLSDPGGLVRKQFGVQSTLGFLPGRITYVIDKKGVVKLIFNSQFRFSKHIEKAIEILKTEKMIPRSSTEYF